MKPRCRNADHDDQPMRGSTRVKCTKCGDEFPCAIRCRHLDCLVERGEPMPDWVTYIPAPELGTPVAISYESPET